MGKDELTEFLGWFRSQTESYWKSYEPQSLEDFKALGVGGTSWKQGTRWKKGLGVEEIKGLEDDWNINFPEEFRTFLSVLNAPTMKCSRYSWSKGKPNELVQVDDAPSFYDWAEDFSQIKSARNWLKEGIMFDVEESDLWRESWGPKPAGREKQEQKLAELINSAPTLIPVVGHRYLLDHVLSTGRPVLSVYQSDVIIYGSNLADYLFRDFGEMFSEQPQVPLGVGSIEPEEVATIPFWGELMV